MTRAVCLLSGACLFFPGIAAAQATPPPVTTARGIQILYRELKDNITRTAEKLSESDYSFRPTSEIRTFGQLIAHFADGQFELCAPAKGIQNPRRDLPNFEQLTSKADIQKAVADSFVFCDDVFAGLTDEGVNQLMSVGPQQVSKGAALIRTLWHGREVYGIATVYLRLKGQVPPSTETAAARGRGAPAAGARGEGRGQ